MAKPHFGFASSTDNGFETQERLAKIDYFLTHSISLPNNLQPIVNLLACARCPLIYTVHEKYGNTVKLWYRSLFEPQHINRFLLASNISSQVIFTTKKTVVKLFALVYQLLISDFDLQQLYNYIACM